MTRLPARKELPSTPDELAEMLSGFRELANNAQDEAEVRLLTSRIAEITRSYRVLHGIGLPATPMDQALEIDPTYVAREHLVYLSDRIANAVKDVENGQNRMLAISMPPRAGKSTMTSNHMPLWLLRRHPEWKIITTSHDGSLTAEWARNIRRNIEQNPKLGIALRRDGGAGAQWQTVEGGGMFSTSVRGALTGRGAKVLVIDDPVKDFVESHSVLSRQSLWDWWLSVALTRLEPPYLVVVVMTRWHEDDFVGRLFSKDHEGDPDEWEKISLSAISDTEDDVLGRSEGMPLVSPLVDETTEQAVARWENIRKTVGTYTFSAMYQQRPAPAKGAIFDSNWWRYWTSDESKVTEDGRVVYLDPSALSGGRWVDSWDMSFKASPSQAGGWVVAQRWVRQSANRYLVAQKRDRWSFTQTLAQMKLWTGEQDRLQNPWGDYVHERLVEDRANGSAIIDVIRETVAGVKPINPTVSKEARARAITPEIESGNVFLPHPGDPGNEWVADLLSELRNFPYDAYDDQVDTLTQALSFLRTGGKGAITVPGGSRPGQPQWQVPRDVGRAALSDNIRRRGSTT
jgi:predicted phage terminase large subunit-like protein